MTANDLSGRRLPLEALGAAERAAWDALCRERLQPGGAFQSFAFARAVAAARPGVRVCVLERAGRPVGFLPFQFAGRWGRLLGAAEPVGHGMSDYFGLVAAPGVRVTPARLLRLAGLTSLLFDHLDESQGAFGLNGEDPEPGLRIDLPAGPEAYWQALRAADKSLLADTERRRRKLIEQVGPLRFQLQAANAGAALEALIHHKRQQYARTGVGDSLAEDWKRALLRELAAGRDPLCQGVLSVLEAGDTWVAMHFGLRQGGLLHYWFPVYNPDLKQASPGRQLLKAIIDASGEAGITTIDRGAGDQPAKRDFATSRHTYHRGLWQNPGPRALCYRAALSARWRLKAS